AWELEALGLPHTVIADSAAATLMAAGEVDCVVTGADRIAANGDTANKIGTYALAVLAAHHELPLYVVAPSSTVDLETPSGRGIP
ncbi:MAG: S-methyl-5-thioribose-1-phosphate isomerase, partial [Pyrinomonadaceae bacterium]